MEYFIVENTWKKDVSIGGWGNGYIAIPKESTWHGTEYSDFPIADFTYSDLAKDCTHIHLNKNIKDTDWLVGFDTYSPYKSNFTKEMVLKQTLEYIEELKELEEIPLAKCKIFTYCPICKFAKEITIKLDYWGKETHKTKCFMCSSDYYYII